MSFGTTLYTLRKSKNMSQESLAGELNTSRQAVSKWENDQSFPEMDKLLLISNLFGVTVDYLLKGENADGELRHELGYYASGENIDGFLIYAHRTAKAMASGIFLILMGGAPYLLIPGSPVLYTVLASFFIVAGVANILIACFRENSYKKITKEQLYIDSGYLTELRGRYVQLKKKYVTILILGIGLGFAALVITTILEDIYHMGQTGYDAIALLLFAVGAFMTTYASVLMWAYGIVNNNAEHIKKLKHDRKPLSFWKISASVVLCIAALAFIYIITGGEGRIASWIENIIFKL